MSLGRSSHGIRCLAKVEGVFWSSRDARQFPKKVTFDYAEVAKPPTLPSEQDKLRH